MSFKSLRVLVLAALAAVFATGLRAQDSKPAAAAAAAGGASASAVLLDAKGAEVGKVSFTEEAGGVKVHADVHGLSAGDHGIHIHAVGSCTAPDFKDAGGHFNPTNKKHGKDNPEGHHAGDLLNLVVKADGTGALDFKIDGATLGAGDMSLMDKDGSSVVVHAKADDYKTDPSGNSGDRIACGVVKAGA
jgi:superoxide dismutase, Cu-Zn family